MVTLTEGVRAFLSEPRFAVTSTIAADGMPHQTVTWFAVDGDALVLNIPSGSAKHRHLQCDPRVSVCIEDGYRFVTISGVATFDDDPTSAKAAYDLLGRRYQGTFTQRAQIDPATMDPKVMAMLSRPRISVRVAITNVIANGVA
jgi:PPOX class probable F420-dependent enzyme